MRSERLASMAADLARVVEETTTLRSLIGDQFVTAAALAADDTANVDGPDDRKALETAFVQGYKDLLYVA